MPPGHYLYDVAVSYASPQRESARQLAGALERLGKRVFYDQDLGHELWGVDLAHSLPETYDRQSQLTVLLISEDYVLRRWPNIEAAAALTKAMREGWDAVLVVYFDEARLPGVPDSIVYLDLADGGKTIADVALELAARLSAKHENSA